MKLNGRRVIIVSHQNDLCDDCFPYCRLMSYYSFLVSYDNGKLLQSVFVVRVIQCEEI